MGLGLRMVSLRSILGTIICRRGTEMRRERLARHFQLYMQAVILERSSNAANETGGGRVLKDGNRG